MSIGIAIYPEEITTGINPGNNGKPFATIDLSPHPANAYIALRTVAACDELIKAAVEAKDLLLAAQEAATGEVCGEQAGGANAPDWTCAKPKGHKYPHATETGGTWGGNTFTPEPGDGCGALIIEGSAHFRCTKGAGHDGDHQADGARTVSEPPLTWPQAAPLPLDVSGDLDAIPANRIGEPAPECSACGATTELAAVRDTGGDGSVLYYCGDLEGCQARRIARAGAR